MADKTVLLHLYDVTNSPDPRINDTVLRINGIARGTLGVGGIFHGAVEVFGEEWSFGYCERGSGVFSCPPKSNPYYSYRETVEMGQTKLSAKRTGQIIAEMSVQWPGVSYEMLSRNCNHFCDELCEKLGVGPIPAWVNRFARTSDSAVELYDQLGQQMNSIREWSSGTYTYFFGAAAPAASVPIAADTAAAGDAVGGSAAGSTAAAAATSAAASSAASGAAAPGSVQGRSWSDFWSGRKGGEEGDGAELLQPGEERSNMGVGGSSIGAGGDEKMEDKGRRSGEMGGGRQVEGGGLAGEEKAEVKRESGAETGDGGREGEERGKGGLRTKLPLLPSVPPEASRSNDSK